MPQAVNVDINSIIASYEKVVGQLQTKLILSDLKNEALQKEIDSLVLEVESLQDSVTKSD